MEPDLVFQKALDTFKNRLTTRQRHDFSITTLQDVKDEVNKIQSRHGTDKKLRGMSRMSKFLEAMRQLEQVISVFLNVSEVVAFIWGPIKFFLVVAASRLEMMECLLDTFTDISEAIPDLQGYESIFKDRPEVLEVLKRCYGDIIQFYHMAFDVFERPGAFGIRDWRRILDSVWKTFRTKFSPVLGSLRRHRELLEQVKSTAIFGEIQRTRIALQQTIDKSNEELKRFFDVMQQKRKQVLDKLGSQGPSYDKGHQRLPDQRYPTSGDWILKNHLFLQWLDPNDLPNDLLYLNGMPGAGKTTLVSRVIDSLTKDLSVKKQPLLNFYFEHGQGGKTLMMDMLRSFIEQLLQQDDAIVDDVHETVLSARPSDLSNVSWLKDVANRIILAQKTCYIIVDGLDECALDQRKSILQWIKTILSESKASNVLVKVLVSGQRDGVIDAVLQDCACTIILDNQTPHLRDIENFSASVLTEIKNQFPDLQDEQEMLRKLDPSRIMEASKGMFMYAKVVLDNFLAQTSIYELEEELQRDYPRGLDEAYDRVAERVLEKTSDSRKRAALQILGLVACAARPLKWREIQCYFCIDASTGSCDPRRRKVGGPKDLCSSFVEAEACASFPTVLSEAQLVMVHNTAKSYLLRSERLDMLHQHEQMSLFSFQYLAGPAFDMVNQDLKSVYTTALTGFYGFFDYAAAHWDHHLLQYVRQASIREPFRLTEERLGNPLSTAWTGFAKKFCDTNDLNLEDSEHGVPLDTSALQSVAPETLDAQGESCNIQEVFGDWALLRRSTKFESLAVSLRQFIQQIYVGDLGHGEKLVHLSLNGPFRPKCSRRACVHFNTGFESEAELFLHTQWHEMAFKCAHSGCYAWLAGFPTKAMLQTHLKRVHPSVDSEEDLFPTKSESTPTTLMQACRIGDIDSVQAFSAPGLGVGLLQLNRALHTAAEFGHFSVCVHLTKQGANPYERTSTESFSDISPIQMSIRLDDYDLFSAFRSAAHERYETAFTEEPLLLDCILDALESSIPQFLMDFLVFNGRRAVPFTLGTILLRAGVVGRRQKLRCPKLLSVERHVRIEDCNVQRGIQTLISTELERHRKCGQPPELCYEKVFVVTDASRWSLLHSLCGGDTSHKASEAVKFLLTRLKPEDTRRHNWKGNPPLFTALQNGPRFQDTALGEREDIIRHFFENDADGAKNTRNADGEGLLEFSLKHATVQIFPLVVELCGVTCSALHYDDILALQRAYISEKLWVVFGVECVGERVQLVVKIESEERNRFICWLMDLDSEPEAIEALQSLMNHLPRETTKDIEAVAVVPTRRFIMSFDNILAPNDSLQDDSAGAARFMLSFDEVREMLKSCRPQPADLGRTQVHKLLPSSLRPAEIGSA